MKIFTNKLPRAWRSSGVIIKADQLEMSNFSFIEESFISTSARFIITIIGKNIIGNGCFSILVYKNSFLVWQEDLFFEGISFSKKQVKIEESSDEEFKIVISRGKKSKGKILLNQVSIYQEPKKEVILEKNICEEPDLYQEDEPTFFIEFTQEVPKKNEQDESLVLPKINDLVETLPTISNKSIENLIPSTIERVRLKKKPRYIKIKSILPKSNDNVISDTISKKREVKDIWITVIDFDININEREVFNYLNQISFGKDKQIFFVKQSSSDPIDFSKYNHVKVFYNNIDIISELEKEWPKKITFIKENLNINLLNEVERIKTEVIS